MNASAIYSKVVPWNDPDEVADAWPNFTPWPSPSPTPSSTPTTSGTQQATPPPTSQPDTYPQEYIWIAIAGTAALFVVAAALIFRRRIRLAS
jgi:hypothetical protein